MPDLQSHHMEFRKHLETFYGSLHLAPPYHSIEKALGVFIDELNGKSRDEQEQIYSDQSLVSNLYLKAFNESGLYKKHRGIIIGLLKGSNPPRIPETYQYLIDQFLR